MKKILFDTDIGGDCDDTGALGILLEAERAKRCKIAAITLSTGSPYAAACADAVCRYYGRDIPIGQTPVRPSGDDPSQYELSYGKHISEVYPGRYTPGSGSQKPENATRLLRRVLAENRGEKLTLVVVGCCINIAALLESGADDLSPLTGRELVSRAVEEVALMGCYFPQEGVPEIWFGSEKLEAEFNIKVDVPAAQKVFSECPVPIAVSHYLIGFTMHTGAALIEKDRKNPVAESYFYHSHGNRESWDPATAYYAVYGQDGYFSLSEEGRVTIDDRGVSTFTACEGGRHRLLVLTDPARAEKRLDAALLGQI